MSLLGFLGGVGSLFGSGGTKSNSSTSQNQNSKTEQASTGKQQTTGKTLGHTVQNTNAKTDQHTTSVGRTDTNTRESSATTGATTNYSSDVLAALDSILTQSLGSGTSQQATDALSGRLGQVQDAAAQPGFDVEGYVSGIANAAQVGIQADLDSRINSILSATGSSETGNSMSALLASRLRNDAASNLAGIVSNATAQGTQIQQGQQESLTTQISGLSGDLTTQLVNLLGAAKGGAQQTTGTAQSLSDQGQRTEQRQLVEEQSKQRIGEQSKQIDSSTTNESAIQQQKTNTQTNTNTKSEDGKKDLFDRLTSALGASSKAA